MSRFVYWTILIGNEPTAFRAADAAELKPTLVQLQRTHPEARMQWFERGRLWSSPDDAQAAREAERAAARKRPSTWRPGGKHIDPRQKYIDAKKAKWTRFKEGVRKRADERRTPRSSERPPEASQPKRTTKEILADWRPPPRPGERPPSAGSRPPGASSHGPRSRPQEERPAPRARGPQHSQDKPSGFSRSRPPRDDRRPSRPREHGPRPPRKPRKN